MGTSCPYCSAASRDSHADDLIELPEGPASDGTRRRPRRSQRHAVYETVAPAPAATTKPTRHSPEALMKQCVAVTSSATGVVGVEWGCVMLVDVPPAVEDAVRCGSPGVDVLNVPQARVVECLNLKRAEDGYRYAVCGERIVPTRAAQGLSWLARRPRACSITHEPLSDTMWVRLSVLGNHPTRPQRVGAPLSDSSGEVYASGSLRSCPGRLTSPVHVALSECVGCPPFLITFG
eukprot:TRINITY_DN20950_c0_g1_i1.p1 TRINITY_DN20950_c0_g1~~TRINITY_DN20950_c0_g1_i1.p1  ORF type:complete len:234 (+),score=15.67 TRINITY_DN20950_c0_g1_i1:54-755(+)